MSRPPRTPPDTEAMAMQVLTLRMPERLWQQLEVVRDDVNKSRVKLNKKSPKLQLSPVSLSSVIRVLLEYGLEHRSSIDFERNIVRPDRIYRERAERNTVSLAQSERAQLFKSVQDLVDKYKITPPEFHRYVGGDRVEAHDFYNQGKLPDVHPGNFVERLKTWIASMKASEETDGHASSAAPVQSRIDGSASPRR